jgi:hypothetical protein
LDAPGGEQDIDEPVGVEAARVEHEREHPAVVDIDVKERMHPGVLGAVVVLDHFLGALAVDEALALVGGDSTREWRAQAHVNCFRMVGQRGERADGDDHAWLASRLVENRPCELRQLVAELQLLKGGSRALSGRDRHVEREPAETSAEALLDLVEVLGLEVLRVDLVRNRYELIAFQERDSRGGGKPGGNLIAARSLLR